MKKQQTVTEHTTGADGQQLAYIALGDSGRRATLYAEDYRRLMDTGFSPCWQHTGDGRGHAYATLGAYNAKGVDCLVPVARLVAQAKAGQIVRYADGNPLNLRSENLKLRAGVARYGAADWYPNAAALLDAGIAPKASDWREGSRPPRKPQKPRRAPCEDCRGSTETRGHPKRPTDRHRAPQAAEGDRKFHRKFPQGYMTV